MVGAAAKRFGLFGLALMALAPQATAETAAIELEVARRHEARNLRQGEALGFAAEAAPGDYFHGVVEVSGGRVDLDLVEADGRHRRRLAAAAEGRVAFQFVAGEGGVRLRATALAPTAGVALTLETRLARAAQAPPPAAGPLSPAIAALAREIEGGGSTEAFWRKIAETGTPLVEPGPDGMVVLTFLARGARHNVRLLGAPSGDHEELQRLGRSDTWFKSFTVPRTTRLSYQLAHDVPDLPGTPQERRFAILATAKADPFNRHPWPAHAPDAYNQQSVLALPEAPPQFGLAARDAARGSLSEFRVASPRLSNERMVTLYRSAGFRPEAADSLLLFVFDARQYLTKVPTPTILDNLVAEGRFPPVAAVFVSEIDQQTRGRELPANPDFADFMAEELLPRVRQEIGGAVPAARTILAGSSYGGLAAATVALRHPGAFGNVISLSGSFWWSPKGTAPSEAEYVAGLVARRPQAPIRFFLSAGLFETARGGTHGIVETSRHLRDVLLAKGYDVAYREYAGGHDYLIWRGALADGLLRLAGRR